MDFILHLNVNILPWIIFIVAGLLFRFYRKRGNKVLNGILIGCCILAFITPFLPRQVFGNWSAIKQLDGKEVYKIVIRPSTPDWEVNLTGSELIIQDKSTINILCNSLHKSDLYFAQHPSRIWETEMVLFTNDGDSLAIKISKSDNNGTEITVPNARLRNDDIDEYLEAITNYTSPQKGVN